MKIETKIKLAVSSVSGALGAVAGYGVLGATSTKITTAATIGGMYFCATYGAMQMAEGVGKYIEHKMMVRKIKKAWPKDEEVVVDA